MRVLNYWAQEICECLPGVQATEAYWYSGGLFEQHLIPHPQSLFLVITVTYHNHVVCPQGNITV